MLGLLRSHRLTLEGRHEVGGGVTSFAFRAEDELGARAGQHGILLLSKTMAKPFSLASAPEEDLVLIGTSLASGSRFKQRLSALEVGHAVTLRGPINKFTLDGAGDEAVMLAQGVGVTPMRSMLAHAATEKPTLDTTLIHVAADGHAYREDTERWAGRASYPRHAEQFRAEVLDATRARPEATFFVAGATRFVTATASLLRGAGVPRGRIREDKYLFFRPGATHDRKP